MIDIKRKCSNVIFAGFLVSFLFIRLLIEDGGASSHFPLKIDLLQLRNVALEWKIEDNLWHHLLAMNIAKGNGISTSVAQPYKPTMFRPPGTGVFAGVSYYLFGEANTKYFFLAFFLFSIFLLTLTIMNVYGILEAITFVLTIAVLDASYLWLTATSLNAGVPVYTLVSLYLFLLVRIYYGKEKNKIFYLFHFLLGVTVSAIILTRSEFIFLPFITIFLIHVIITDIPGLPDSSEDSQQIALKKTGSKTHIFNTALHRFASSGKGMIRSIFKIDKKTILSIALFIIGLIALLGPWSLRNYRLFNTFSLGGRAGFILIYKGLAAEAVAKGTDYWVSRRNVNINRFIHSNIDNYLNEGWKPEDFINIENSMARTGLKLFIKYPGSYLKVCWEEFKDGAAFNPTGLRFLGPPEDSFTEHILGKKPHYNFALLCFAGFVCYLFKFPLRTLLIFHIAFYYIIINAIVNVESGLYNTYVLFLYAAAFSLFVSAFIKALFRLLKGRLLREKAA